MEILERIEDQIGILSLKTMTKLRQCCILAGFLYLLLPTLVLAQDATPDSEVPVLSEENQPETGVDSIAAMMQENQSNIHNKAGVGLTVFSYFAGLMAYFDYPLNPKTGSMLHTRLTTDFTSTGGESANLTINRTILNVNYRTPLPLHENVYGGVGVGYGNAELIYQNSDQNINYSASGGGLLVIGNLGWEKYWERSQDHFFVLTISFNLGTYLAYNDDYDDKVIPDQTNHREIVNAGWRAAQQITHLVVGFGSTF